MRGHITKKNNLWYVVLELEREDGGRNRKWLSPRKELSPIDLATLPPKKQAEKLLLQKLAEIENGTYFEPSEQTVAEYLERWIEDYCKPNLRQKTWESYQLLIKLHINPELGKVPLIKLKPAHLQKLYSSKLKGGRADGKPGGLSSRSIRYIHAIIHEALSHAVKWEIIPRNVAEAVTPPKQNNNNTTKEKAQAWNAKQLALFLDAVKEDNLYPLYFLAAHTGMRQSELLGLRWKDINFNKKTVKVEQIASRTSDGIIYQPPKTKTSRRTITISKEVVNVLKAHRKNRFVHLANTEKQNDSMLVFLSTAGTPIQAKNLLRHFRSVVNRLDLPPITFHGLRHTHATILLSEGWNVKIVSERLGHSMPSVTWDVYSHLLPGQQEKAAENFSEILSLAKGQKNGRTFTDEAGK